MVYNTALDNETLKLDLEPWLKCFSSADAQMSDAKVALNAQRRNFFLQRS